MGVIADGTTAVTYPAPFFLGGDLAAFVLRWIPLSARRYSVRV